MGNLHLYKEQEEKQVGVLKVLGDLLSFFKNPYIQIPYIQMPNDLFEHLNKSLEWIVNRISCNDVSVLMEHV